MKSQQTIFILMAAFLFVFASCKKEPGQGGLSSISGKVFVKNYNSTFTILNEEFYGNDIYVYIIYGDDKDYSDRIRTSYDGTYEFKFLRKGTYHVYTYSKDSTLQTINPVGVVQDVEITKNKENVVLPDLVIFN
jgi:hypothetical protein